MGTGARHCTQSLRMWMPRGSVTKYTHAHIRYSLSRTHTRTHTSCKTTQEGNETKPSLDQDLGANLALFIRRQTNFVLITAISFLTLWSSLSLIVDVLMSVQHSPLSSQYSPHPRTVHCSDISGVKPQASQASRQYCRWCMHTFIGIDAGSTQSHSQLHFLVYSITLASLIDAALLTR